MSTTKVIEKSKTYRNEPGTFEEVVAKLESNGWEIVGNQANFVVMAHDQMPGHSRVIAKPDGAHS